MTFVFIEAFFVTLSNTFLTIQISCNKTINRYIPLSPPRFYSYILKIAPLLPQLTTNEMYKTFCRFGKKFIFWPSTLFITWVANVLLYPWQVRMMSQSPGLDIYDMSRLRVIITGGSILGPTISRELQEKLPTIRFIRSERRNSMEKYTEHLQGVVWNERSRPTDL